MGGQVLCGVMSGLSLVAFPRFSIHGSGIHEFVIGQFRTPLLVGVLALPPQRLSEILGSLVSRSSTLAEGNTSFPHKHEFNSAGYVKRSDS